MSIIHKKRRTLFHGRQESAEIVVDEDDISSFFCNVRPALAHRHANIRYFQRRRIIHCIPKTNKSEVEQTAHRVEGAGK